MRPFFFRSFRARVFAGQCSLHPGQVDLPQRHLFAPLAERQGREHRACGSHLRWGLQSVGQRAAHSGGRREPGTDAAVAAS